VTDRLIIGVVVENSKLYVCARPSTVVGPPRTCTSIGQQLFSLKLRVRAETLQSSQTYFVELRLQVGKQKVLGKTNPLLSSEMTRTARKTVPPKISSLSQERLLLSLLSNDIRIDKTPTNSPLIRYGLH
jgi:hypothetical protein